MKRYGSKQINRLKSLLKILSFLLLLFSVGNIVVYHFFAPGPFKRYVYTNFATKKILYSLLNTLNFKNYDTSAQVIDHINLSLDPAIEDKINENPLTFGKEWRDSYFSGLGVTNNPVVVKIRGHKDSKHHWGGRKKSYWIKSKAGTFIDFWKRASLTNIRSEMYTIDVVGYDLAKYFGLLSPRTKFVNASINNEFRGLFHLIEDFDKYYVQNIERTSGDIYALDEYQNTKTAYYSPKYWRKKSSNRKKEKEDNNNLVKYLKCIKNDNCDLSTHIRVKKYLGHNILFEFLGTLHADNYHNQRLFMDPSIGKFEPIVWDIFWFDPERERNQSYHPGDQKLLIQPKYRFEKLRIQKNIFETKVTEQKINQTFDTMLEKLTLAIKQDRFRGFSRLFTYDEWRDKAEEMREKLLIRRRDILNDSNKIGDLKLIPSVNRKRISLIGKTPHLFKLVGFTGLANTKLIIHTATQRKKVHISNGKIKQDIYLASMWKADKKESSTAEIIKHGLSVQFENLGPGNIKSVILRNLITQKNETFPLSSQEVTADLELTSALSHDFEEHIKKKVINVGPGIVVYDADVSFQKGATLKFAPGTTVLMKKGVSIFTEGRVLMEGTEKDPIVVKPYGKDPWGTLSILGEGGHGSKFKHVKMSGGKNDRHGNVFYSGMLNCYFANCSIEKSFFTNNFGDDAVNYKAAHGLIKDSIFYKTAFDAIDIDFSKGDVFNNIIYKTGNDGVDLGTGHAKIYKNIIYRSGDKGVSVGERSYPFIFNNFIIENYIGIASKDNSEFFAFNNLFDANKTTVSSYQKKSAFGGSHPIIFNNKLLNTNKLFKTDAQSHLVDVNNVKIGNIKSINSIPISDINFLKNIDYNLAVNKTNHKLIDKMIQPLERPSIWEKFEKLRKADK